MSQIALRTDVNRVNGSVWVRTTTVSAFHERWVCGTYTLFMFVKAGLQLGDVDFRFDAARTLGATLVLDGSHDLPDRLARVQFGDDLRARLRTLPAVNGVMFSSRHPAEQGMGGPVEAEGRPAASWSAAAWAHQETIAPGFFRALGIPLPAGREFSDLEAQGAGPQVVVVSESLALG